VGDLGSASRRIPEGVGGSNEVLAGASLLRHLPPDHEASAVITPDGVWHDLEDFGWRMMREPSPGNASALAKWRLRYQTILTEFADMVGVEVVYHC
jgi:hypothetical protein